jgi:hypothetical protein
MPKGAPFVEYSTKLYNVTIISEYCFPKKLFTGKRRSRQSLVVRIERSLGEELEVWM